MTPSAALREESGNGSLARGRPHLIPQGVAHQDKGLFWNKSNAHVSGCQNINPDKSTSCKSIGVAKRRFATVAIQEN